MSAMIQIQKIHDDYWRIADKNNSRIASISKVGQWYVVADPLSRYMGRFTSFSEAVNFIVNTDN